ncbi:fasciclin domain-containing protein [Pseudomonadota bacterium]
MTKFASSLIITTAIALTSAMPAHAKGPKGTSVWDIVQASEVHTTLEAAIICTEISSLLEGNGQVTLFAPTDEAFGCLNLDESNICSTFSKNGLTGILADHLTTGRRDQGEVVSAGSIKMASRNRQAVDVDLSIPQVLVGDAALDLGALDIGEPDSGVTIANGIIHFVGEGVVGQGRGDCDDED